MFPNLIRPAGFGSVAVSGGSRSYSTAIAPTQGRTGFTTVVSTVQDDNNYPLGDIGFDFPLYGSLYRTNIVAGSNGYITFGFGSSAYSGLSRTFPGRALMVAAADHSWSYLGLKIATGSFQVRWEGQYFRGSDASSVFIWEVTFFPNGVIQLALDACPASLGGATVSSLTKGDNVTFTDYVPNIASARNSFVFTPNDAAGNSHTVQTGSYA